LYFIVRWVLSQTLLRILVTWLLLLVGKVGQGFWEKAFPWIGFLKGRKELLLGQDFWPIIKGVGPFLNLVKEGLGKA